MRLSVRDFEILTVLAREQHFGRAAERLGMRQPQLSIRIAEVEQAIGITLFKRRPRATLTPAGEIVIDGARIAFMEFDAAVRRAGRAAKGEVGLVRVAIASSVMLSEVPTSLRRFRERWPGVELSLRDMHSAQQWEALCSGQIDLAITREVGGGAAMRTEVLGEQNFAVVLPRDHRLAGQSKIDISQLSEEPFVLFNSSIAPSLLQQIYSLCETSGFTPNVSQQADEWYTILGFVRAGFGITIALDLQGAVPWRDVVYIPLVGSEIRSPVYLCWDEERSVPSRSLLIDWILKERPIRDLSPSEELD